MLPNPAFPARWALPRWAAALRATASSVVAVASRIGRTSPPRVSAEAGEGRQRTAETGMGGGEGEDSGVEEVEAEEEDIDEEKDEKGAAG